MVGWVPRWTFPRGRRVRMGELWVRPIWELEGVDPDGQEPTRRVRIEVRDGVPEVREVVFTAHPAGREVLLKDLRELKLEDIVEAASAAQRARDIFELGSDDLADASVITVDDLLAAEVAGARAANSVRREARRVKITDDLLRQVAEVYRSAPSAPAKAVEEHFGKSRRTATYWVAEARSRGFLGKDD